MGRLLMMAQIATAIDKERRLCPEDIEISGCDDMSARVLVDGALNRVASAVAEALGLSVLEKKAFLAEAGCFDGD